MRNINSPNEDQFVLADEDSSVLASNKKDSIDHSAPKVLPILNDGSLDYDGRWFSFCIFNQLLNLSNLYISALYEDDDDTNLSMESHGSVVTHLLSQVKIGMDLTKVVLPTFILERRSLLEMYADYFAHPDLFLK